MPEGWSKKRERQYEHIKDGLEERGESEEEEEDASGGNEMEPSRTVYKAPGIAIVAVDCGTIKDVAAIHNCTWRKNRKRPAHSLHYVRKSRRPLGQRARRAVFS